MKTGDAVAIKTTVPHGNGITPDYHVVEYLVFVKLLTKDGIFGDYTLVNDQSKVFPSGMFLWDNLLSFEVWHNSATQEEKQ